MPSICISIPTLKILRIKGNRDLLKCVLKIHAPGLVTFNYSGYVAKEYVLSSFLTLEEATVSLVYYAREERTGHVEAIRQLLRALTHVKCLTLKNPPFQAKNLFRNSPAYLNVKRLKTTRLLNSDVVVIALLKLTPNLESLVIDKFQGRDFHGNESKLNHNDEDNGWTSLDMADTGHLFIHLKSVCFKPKVWGPREISCVKVILRNAKALQSPSIYHDDSRHPINATEQELLVQIESFPRASASCTFKISLGNKSKEVENLKSAGILNFQNKQGTPIVIVL